jgi:hypothetical protein
MLKYFPNIASGNISHQPIMIDVEPISYDDHISIHKDMMWKVHDTDQTTISCQNLKNGKITKWTMDLLGVKVIHYYHGRLFMVIKKNNYTLVSWQPDKELIYHDVVIPHVQCLCRYTCYNNLIHVWFKSWDHKKIFDYLLDLETMTITKVCKLKIPQYSIDDNKFLHDNRIICFIEQDHSLRVIDYNIISKTHQISDFAITTERQSFWMYDNKLYSIGYHGFFNITDNIKLHDKVPKYIWFNGTYKIYNDGEYTYILSPGENDFDLYKIKMNSYLSKSVCHTGQVIELQDMDGYKHKVDVAFLQHSLLYQNMTSGKWKTVDGIQLPYSTDVINDWIMVMTSQIKDTDISTLIYTLPVFDYLSQIDELNKVMNYLAIELNDKHLYIQLFNTCYMMTSVHQLIVCLFRKFEFNKDEILLFIDLDKQLLSECITSHHEYKFHEEEHDYVYQVDVGVIGSGHKYNYSLMKFK